jgi:conjugative relaxase-like TrwC/TraI family protein
MLVPNPITSTAQAKSYFFEKDNYYLSGEGQKLTQWWGNGAKRLGLSGQVDPERFQELLEGRIDEHTQIGLRLDGSVSHRPGSDLTFMAPKSISILGFIGGDQRICDAHMNAVKMSMGEVERMCARAKFSKKDGAIFENSNNLIAALFPHDTSRLLDPHMHTHAVVMNATLRSDGMWRALASEMGYEKLNGYMERVNAWQIYFGNIYRTELAKELKSLGYEIRPAGKNGQFEIKGVPQEVLEHFSQRRKQITDIVGNRTASKFNDIVAKATREPKQAADRGDLKAHWDNEIKKMNFDARAFVQQAMSASAIPEQAQDKSDTTLAGDFVQSAVESFSVWGTSFSFDQLFNKVAMAGMGEMTHSQIKTEINNQLKSGQLIGLDRAGTKLTTQSLLDKEQSIVERASALSAQKPKSKDIDELSDAAKLALKHNISVINVSASRQFELLESSLGEIESKGYKLHLLSPNRDMAKDLSSNVKRNNSGLFKWFRNIGKPQIGQTVRGFVYRHVERNKSPLAFLSHGKHVAVIDNAHKLSVYDVNSLLELSHQDGTHLVFLNNTKGLIGSHNTLELLSKANVPTTTIQTGDYNNKLLMGLCTQSMKLDLATGNTLVVTDSKRRIAPLTQEVRNELKYQGKLSREEIVITGLKPKYIKQGRITTSDFEQGNMLRLYHRDRPFEDFKVRGSIAGEGVLSVETLSGRSRKLRLKELRDGNFKLFESSELKLARGDRVRGTATMQKEGIEASVNYHVIDVNDKYMVLGNGDKQLKLSSKHAHLPLEHDYVRTISQAAGSFDKVILDAKAYSISSNLINELSLVSVYKCTHG